MKMKKLAISILVLFLMVSQANAEELSCEEKAMLAGATAGGVVCWISGSLGLIFAPASGGLSMLAGASLCTMDILGGASLAPELIDCED
jgi:hypothetical protein